MNNFNISYAADQYHPSCDTTTEILTAKLTVLNKTYQIMQSVNHNGLSTDSSRHLKTFRLDHEAAALRSLQIQAICDFYTQLGWSKVSYSRSHYIMDISMWVLHHVSDMNMNLLDKNSWWFQNADEAAFFKLRWG
jgi:hypothetical protein